MTVLKVSESTVLAWNMLTSGCDDAVMYNAVTVQAWYLLSTYFVCSAVQKKNPTILKACIKENFLLF